MIDAKLNRFIALGVLLVSAAVYLVTAARTVVFWDVGEFCAAAYMMQVPHPPGSPLFLLVGRVVSMIPFHPDIAYRMHSISAISSAIGVMFLYLVIVKLSARFRGKPNSAMDRLVVYGSAIVGAFSLAFSSTYWGNAIEAEVYGLSMLFVAVITWLVMRWVERHDQPHNEKYLFLIAYLIGLSIGVHLLAVLMIFPVMMIVYFMKFEYERKTFLQFMLATVAVFFIVYPGIVKWLPSMLDGQIGQTKNDLFMYLPVVLIAGAIYGAYRTARSHKKLIHIGLVSFLLIIVGYSTYTTVIIRANVPDLPMNENDPSNMERLVSYLGREQYGDAPVLQRRYSQEPMHAPTRQNYTSDWDFLFRYQINHMYIRYLLWNYVGIAGDEQDSGVDWKQTLAIPFLLGLWGIYFHFRKDWKMALPYMTMFLAMGVILALYQNQQEPQPRERDYFYVGSFFVFSVWIGLGLIALIDYLKTKLAGESILRLTSAGTVAVFAFAIPGNFLRINWHDHDLSNNYVAWDYSYNILQSCEKDAILFTNGDNDTFPLWYLQDVERVRRDIRIVNLSLVNTSWYVHQLKNYKPHGTAQVPISLTNAQIERLQPILWETRQMEIPVSTDVFHKFGISDTALTNKGKIAFTMPFTMQFGDTRAIKVQDIMVRDIIMTNNWQRPIYFAVTVSPDSKIGLDDYLWMDGLAWRLKPQRFPAGEGGIHPEIMWANIMAEEVTPSDDAQYGYLFRGLNDPNQYFDENQRRLTMNYRSSFIRLALHYNSTENNTEKARQILARMEKALPRDVIPMDWRLMADLMSFYQRLGLEDVYQQYSVEVEQTCNDMIARNQIDMQSFYNPYRILLELYEGRHDYSKALDILSRIEALYPNDPNLKARRQQYEALMRGQTPAADTVKH